jgi:hypothetical protein
MNKNPYAGAANDIGNESVSSGYKAPSVFNPEEILRRKRESDMVFRNIKRYNQKTTS